LSFYLAIMEGLVNDAFKLLEYNKCLPYPQVRTQNSSQKTTHFM
jgi:hypothetical protein